MKKILFSISLLSVLFLFTACDKDDDELNPGNPTFTPMKLDELEVGQTFRFVLLKGASYHDPNNYDFNYTGDTLVLEVTKQEGNDRWIVSERFTDGSKVHTDSSHYWGEPHKVHENFWTVQNDSLTISPIMDNSLGRSHLLFFGYRSFSLNDSGTDEVNINGWKIDPPGNAADFNYYTEDYSLFDQNYDRLNLMVRNSPMAYDGNGQTYVLSRKHGFVKTSSYSAWTSEGLGWDRLD